MDTNKIAALAKDYELKKLRSDHMGMQNVCYWKPADEVMAEKVAYQIAIAETAEALRKLRAAQGLSVSWTPYDFPSVERVYNAPTSS